MRLYTQTLTCLALAALSASALEKEFVEEMLQSARNIERDASMVSVALKIKKPDAVDVKSKIGAMNTDLDKLHALVAQFESTHPNLSERDDADWRMVKEHVQLIEIFHFQKTKLASQDIQKHRSLIRAHADGVAKRAQRLQEMAGPLHRTPVS